MTNLSPTGERRRQSERDGGRAEHAETDTAVNSDAPRSPSPDIIEAFTESESRAIMQATFDGARSAKEISDRCELPLSTTYRKLDHLTSLGILEEGIEIQPGSNHTTTFTLCIDGIGVTITDDGVEFRVSRRD